MPLFQNIVVSKYLKSIDKQAISNAYSKFKAHFHNPDIQENIRNSKEEQYQGEFLIDLFVNVLGYTKNPQPNFNLTTEYKNVKDSKKADGAIIIQEKVKAVIELKGTDTTDLNKIETQAFGYKNNQPECVYIIISNYEKLRFYIDNAIEYIEFNLFTLTEKEFELLYLCLSYDNISKDIPKLIKEESIGQEDQITKQLYKDYSLFKNKLYENLVLLNPNYNALELFKKSQKLLDRFLFLFFAEDRQLLPPNSVRLILNDWKDLQERDENIPLYNRFKKYFEYLNTGFKGKRYDVFAYNGGLFKPDELLDTIKIDDQLLYEYTYKLSEYDFDSEIDVNILGHIFENSLNELEEVKAKLEGNEVEKSQTKRKKDGVFYTPKYITKYIVENTVGVLCTEKKRELEINDEIYSNAKLRSRKRLDNLKAYRDWLLQITICDPACGSGAFLNQALDYLINEHHYLDELSAKYNKDTLILSDIENSILENNLFGVDINEESVEIAKLSLWLRTARPNRKLNDLNNNIKCGNSLIDDLAVAGEKAFNWEESFPTVFEKGGFDVVIGNPPYGAKLDSNSKDFIKNRYIAFNKNYDIYAAFLQLAFELITNNGIWGFINPVSWQSNENYFDLRYYFKENGEIKIAIKLPYDVFEDAYVDTGIYIACKSKNKNYDSLVFDFPVRAEITASTLQFLELNTLPSSYWTSLDTLKLVLNPSFYELLPKINKGAILLKDVTESVRGILPNNEDVVEIEQEESKPFFVGNLFRYELQESLKGVIYSAGLKEKPKDYNWFVGERILVRRLINRQFRIMGCITSKEFVNKKDIYVIKSNNNQISNYFLLAIINSKLISYLKTKGSASATKDDFSQLTLNDLREIPIKHISLEEQKIYINSTLEIVEYFSCIQNKKDKFINRLKSNFDIKKISTKLDAFFEFDFKTILAELKKVNVTLSLSQQDEWEEYFNFFKTEINNIRSSIEKTDNEIDQMVYKLYNLTEEEIKIVESA